jgi:hypothetical protein
MPIAYGYVTSAGALSNGQRRDDQKMAWEMLHFIGMRPIPALFVMAAIGFAFILHKKDVPEATDSKLQTSKPSNVSKHNSMKRALYMSRVAAKTVSKQRKENELP